MSADRTSIQDAIDNINSVRESIRSTKGEKYFLVVEITAALLKRKELIAGLIIPMVEAVGAPKELVSLISHLNADIDARTVRSALTLAEIDPGPSAELAKEILNWGERLNSVEHDSLVATLPQEVKDFLKGRGE